MTDTKKFKKRTEANPVGETKAKDIREEEEHPRTRGGTEETSAEEINNIHSLEHIIEDPS